MIEKMKMVYIVSSASNKEAMLDGLKELGILHIAEKKAPDRVVSERFTNLSKTASMLMDYAPDKKEQKKAKKSEKTPILSDEKFNEMYQSILEAVEKKTNLTQKVTTAKAEIERSAEWGEFSPAELKELNKVGLDFHFYRLAKNDFKVLAEREDVKYIKLDPVGKMDTVAVIGTLPADIPASEFNVSEKSISEWEKEISTSTAEIEECDKVFKNAALYTDSFNDQMLKAQNDEIYSSASETACSDEDFVWLSGYIPEADIDKFKEAAALNNWAYAEDDVAEDDEQVPTKVKYNKVSRFIKPVFDILGILPGYRETDISLWFFLFFILFFAMIIGDGGYGVLILIGTLALKFKTKKFGDVGFLLLILSIATIFWGAITGTWFGMESAMNIPFLKALVIPQFANYPGLFNVTALEQQNTIMKFSFSIGAIQMALGSLISIKKKLSQKNLSWVADLGWLIAVIAMYMLSLFLVIGESIPVMPVFIGIGLAFLMVVLFGGMSPDKTFGQGLKAGVADAFTVFLNTISCFGNVMSYIRLFAVGMAGFAISQSFNGIGSGFSGPFIIVGAVIVIIGHVLNIIMCFLSVVVHGVRLNVLEFSGQAGLEWTGIGYEPFKEKKK